MRRRAILTRSLELAKDRYRAGYASYLEQLDAQRNLFATQIEAIGIRQAQLSAIARLHATLGERMAGRRRGQGGGRPEHASPMIRRPAGRRQAATAHLLPPAGGDVRTDGAGRCAYFK